MTPSNDPLAAYRASDGTLDSWAWPGGYPLYYLTRDGDTVCSSCASREIDHSQAAIATDVNWEDPSLYCDDCNQRIASAYAEDEEN